LPYTNIYFQTILLPTIHTQGNHVTASRRQRFLTSTLPFQYITNASPGKGNALALVSNAEIDAIVKECMDIIDSSTKKLEKWTNDNAGSSTPSEFQDIDETLKAMTEVREQMKSLTEKTKENVKAEEQKK
jgi:flagellar motility protein MotE (MotC chaperone)